MNFTLLKELLANKKYTDLKNELLKGHTADIAEFIAALDEKYALLVFRLLPKGIAADVFAYLSPETQSELYVLVDEKELHDILSFSVKPKLTRQQPAARW